MNIRSGSLIRAAMGLVLLLGTGDEVRAQASGGGRSTFVTPFPDGGTYKVFVFGDSLGNGLHGGLKQALRLEPDLRVDNRSRPGSRLMSSKGSDWVATMKASVRDDAFNIAVMTFGVNDRVAIRVNRKWYRVGSPQWSQAYARRIDALLRATKAGGAAIYWVGLPVLRGPKSRSAAQTMNSIARERVYRNGGKYVDTWEGFTDGDGNYSPYGPDLTGRIRRMRSKDGVFFTLRGYRKLAHYIERLIRRDVALARAERDVPLAGDVAEQRQVRRARASQRASGGKVRKGEWAARVKADPRAERTGDHKAAHATVRVRLPGANGAGGKTVQIRILRPALPAVVVGHIQRRSRASGGDRLGRNLLRFDADGTGMLNSVASGLDTGRGGSSSRISVTQTPYYKALIKGESLRPKPGRTDDFSWPPQNRIPFPATGS